MTTIQLPQFVAAVEVLPSTYNAVERTVQVVWATGQRKIVNPWPFDDPFVEELGLTAGEVQLDRLNSGAAVLDSHGQMTHKPDGQPGLQDQIGVVERAWVAGGKGHALIRFGVRDAIAWIRDEVAAGTFRNLSMRYRVHLYTDTGEFDLTLGGLPVRRATLWTPDEISILPVPADFGTEIRALEGAATGPPLPITLPALYPCELRSAPPTTGPPMIHPTAPIGGVQPTTPAAPVVAPVAPGAPAVSAAAPPGVPPVVPPLVPMGAAPASPAPVVAPVAPVVAHAAPVAPAAPLAPVAPVAPVAPAVAPAAAPAAPAPVYAAPAVAPAPEAPPANPDDIARGERTRIADIYAAATVLPEEGRSLFAQQAVDAGHPVDQFRAAVLERLRGAPGQTPVSPQVQVTREGEGDRFAGLEEALLHRCDPTKYKVTERGNPFVGMPLLRVAEELLNIHGQPIRSRAPRALANQALSFRAAHTTSDFPNLLGNVVNKILQDAYELTVRTFTTWARRRTIPDFKTVTSIILHGGSQLEAVPEDAEIKRGTLSESAETWSLSEYAKIWALTRRAVINDDMNAFDDLPRRFAAQAANLESTVVYALWITNALMSDGFALFDDTEHGNDAGSTALDTVGVGVVRSKMQRQVDDDQNRITVIPRHLIVPPELETKAAQMNAGIVAPSSEAVANIWRGTFTSIQTEPRLVDASQWYVIADPSQAPGIEYGFLAGENGPMVETRDGWDVLGTEIRVVHSFGAGVVDFRGMQRVDES